ncbi:MAG: transposase [Elusimicrobia bacterium]|nr:transposase [Elusimicrobiota bacterium]
MRNSVIEVIKTVGADLSARIHCMVIAIDHFHILVTLPDGKIISLSKLIAIIKVRITQYFSRAGKPAPTPPKIWQRSYYEHIIRDEKDFLQKARYIENHPVKEIGNDYAEWH